MSHFAVAVLTDENTTIGELLAPYDERIKVEKYVEYTREELIGYARKKLEEIKNTSYAEYQKHPKKFLRDHCYGDPRNQFYQFLSTEFTKQYNESDEEILARELAKYPEDMVDSDGNAYTTYNPNSKFDWYGIGESFANMLISLDTGEYANELPVSQIDFPKMAKAKKDKLLSLEDYIAKGEYKTEYLRRMYPDEETYELIKTTFWTRAVVTPDGKWHEIGQMGWFCYTSEEPEAVAPWVRNYFDSFMKPAIKNGWTVHIVHCHI